MLSIPSSVFISLSVRSLAWYVRRTSDLSYRVWLIPLLKKAPTTKRVASRPPKLRMTERKELVRTYSLSVVRSSWNMRANG